MEIIRLPWGELAPKDSDCIHVQEEVAGRWQLNTSALESCDADDEDAASDATIGGAPYASYDAAEAAGLAIAGEHCAGVVYISRARAGEATEEEVG